MSQETSSADLVIRGRVFLGLAAGFAEALAIGGGRVAIPGLNEAHMHHLPFGLGPSQVNLRAAERFVRSTSCCAGCAPPPSARRKEWVLGRGYDHGELDVGRHPLAEELDRAVPDHPVVIVRTCGHMAVANTAAMRLAGVGHNTPDPEGGAIKRRDGKLTGLFKERARRLIGDRVPPPSEASMVDAIDAAGHALAAYGFTSGSDMNVGMTAGAAEIAAYRRAEADGRLHQRMWLVLAGNPEGIAHQAAALGLSPGVAAGPTADALLALGAVKVFADGSAGGLTAAFFDPYLESAGGGTGILCFPDETMHGLLACYHREGWQLDIHAIGDAAIEQVLSGMEAASTAAQPIAGRRHRLEHCGFVTRGQRARELAARSSRACRWF